MTRRLLGAIAIALSCAAGADADSVRRPDTVLSIAMTHDCSPTDRTLEIARAEAARVWDRGDVAIRWVSVSDLPHRSARSTWLVVQCVDGPVAASAVRVMAIASIRFINSIPMNAITLNVGNANALLDDDNREDRVMSSRFPSLRQTRLGRMIGRAIAHEIGHFLSESQAHTPNGLMRATHTVAALTGMNRGPFKVPQNLGRTLQARRDAIDDPEEPAARDPEGSRY